jgi:hypothetical protein
MFSAKQLHVMLQVMGNAPDPLLLHVTDPDFFSPSADWRANDRIRVAPSRIKFIWQGRSESDVSNAGK